jgi:hypothetical protein
MEKELQKYRSSLKVQSVFFAVFALILVFIIVLGALRIIQPVGADEHWADAWNGFISGAGFGIVAILIGGIVLNLRAMNNPAALKKLYIKEHDERGCQIAYRSGHASYFFNAAGLLLGVIVGGYFSPLISLTCLGCLFYICLVRLGLKIYYSRKI